MYPYVQPRYIIIRSSKSVSQKNRDAFLIVSYALSAAQTRKIESLPKQVKISGFSSPRTEQIKCRC